MHFVRVISMPSLNISLEVNRMNIEKAREIVNQYGGALAKESVQLRRESLLPCDKNTIVIAHKLFIAYHIEWSILTDELENALTIAIGTLSGFIPDNEAREANAVLAAFKAGKISSDDQRMTDAMKLVTNLMYSPEIAEDFSNFIYSVRDLDREDPLYQQRICTLAGIEYISPKKKSFWASLFG